MSEITNVKTVRFAAGQTEGYGDTLYCHDYGQRIRFEGITLPAYYEVHFSDRPDGIGVPKLGNENGVEVPNFFLNHPGVLYLWIYLHFSESDGTTVYKAALEVAVKAETEVEPTPEQQDIIHEAVEALNDANGVLEQMEDLAEELETYPKITYVDCYGWIRIGMAASGQPDKWGLNIQMPTGYAPEENDLLMIRIRNNDLKAKQPPTQYFVSFYISESYLDEETGNVMMTMADGPKYRIFNMRTDFEEDTTLFEKDYIYMLRYRSNVSNQIRTYGYDLVAYTAGMKEAQEAAQEALAAANDLLDGAAVRYDEAQELTSEEQAQARANISAPMLDANGKVPSSQLPGYVDDVVEYASRSAFPETGETGKIYIALDTNLTYRWGGSAYVEISPSLALGETPSTAFPGDRGVALENDKAPKNNPVFTNSMTMSRYPARTIGANSVALGSMVTAEGEYSTAFGYNTRANAAGSFAEGNSTLAYGRFAHAMGWQTSAPLIGMLATGMFNVIPSTYSQWVSGTSYAVGDCVWISGGVPVAVTRYYRCITANSDSTFKSSKWEEIPFSGDVLLAIGNGKSAANRSNALTVLWNGDVKAGGDVYSGVKRLARAEEVATVADDLSDAEIRKTLHDDEIDNTTQVIEFNQVTGNVTKVYHKKGNIAVRTDTFTYDGNTITEVRTLRSGESLTIVTNTSTLSTTITYADA